MESYIYINKVVGLRSVDGRCVIYGCQWQHYELLGSSLGGCHCLETSVCNVGQTRGVLGCIHQVSIWKKNFLNDQNRSVCNILLWFTCNNFLYMCVLQQAVSTTKQYQFNHRSYRAMAQAMVDHTGLSGPQKMKNIAKE